MAKITLSNLRHSYYPNPTGPDDFALKKIDLDWQDGGAYALLGPSGCGKSTLLRMVAGLESVTAGEIRIGDRVVNDLEPANRDIAMVFQNYALYPHMTVFENMAFGLKLQKKPKEKRKNHLVRNL